jgi:hypothetical protein
MRLPARAQCDDTGTTDRQVAAITHTNMTHHASDPLRHITRTPETRASASPRTIRGIERPDVETASSGYGGAVGAWVDEVGRVEEQYVLTTRTSGVIDE